MYIGIYCLVHYLGTYSAYFASFYRYIISPSMLASHPEIGDPVGDHEEAGHHREENERDSVYATGQSQGATDATTTSTRLPPALLGGGGDGGGGGGDIGEARGVGAAHEEEEAAVLDHRPHDLYHGLTLKKGLRSGTGICS